MLPVLVTDHIARYLDVQDLFVIGILSSPLHKQANSIIYNNLILDLSGENARRKATLLLRTLLTTPSALSNVCSISLIGYPLAQWRIDTVRGEESVEDPVRGVTPPAMLIDLQTMFTPKELDLHKKTASLQTMSISSDWETSLPMLCLDIINLLQCHLENLYIGSDYFRYPDFRDSLRAMFVSGGFRNLQSCSLCEDILHAKGRAHINAVRDWDDTLLAQFLAPNIKWIKAVMTLNPEAVKRMHRSSITRLTLHHCQISEFDLNGLLAATPRLSYLEFHASVGFRWYISHWNRSGMSRCLGVDALFSALHYVRRTLTELVIAQSFDEDSYHFHPSYLTGLEPPFRHYNELSELKHLSTSVIPYASLLGWNPKAPQLFDWQKILPASLHHVTFTDDLSKYFRADGWRDQDLMPVFSGLASWLAMRTQGNQPPVFTLRLRHIDTDFNEKARRALSQMCEERGVFCTIEKLQRDRVDNNPRLLRGAGRGYLRGRDRGRFIGHGLQ